MSTETVPPCSSCVHNLHRVGDGRQPRPEPTELCSNSLGVFHMVDCPLSVGLPCTYYEAAPAEHPTTGDAGLEAAREEMNGDFLGWRYRRRVRWLTKPTNVVPVGIVLDVPPEAEEVVPEILAMRVAPPGDSAPAPAAEPGAVPGADSSAPTGSAAPAAPAAPERYPGQRRSEERLAKKRARLAALDAAKAARLAAVAANPPPPEPGDAEESDEEGDDFGAEVVDESPQDTGPKTVEQVLAALPDAPLPINEPRRQGGQRVGPGGGSAGGPPRDGQPRRRRRRGRRGGGPGPGPGSGSPQPRGPRPGPRSGPRPGGQSGGSRGGNPS